LSTWEIFDADAGPLSLFGDRGMRRFWLRALLAPRVAWGWREHALSLYRRRGAAIPNARVLSKPLHGYLRRGLNPATRVSALVEHYRLFGSLLSSDCLRAFCAGEPLELARLAGRKGSFFRLYLINSTMEQTQREGECTLCLVREGWPTILSRVTFNLCAVDGRLSLAIGGLQGPSAGHSCEVIAATRDLFRLRPKDATLLVARAIAEGLGASVHAVGDALHVHRTLPDVRLRLSAARRARAPFQRARCGQTDDHRGRRRVPGRQPAGTVLSVAASIQSDGGRLRLAPI
jgi:uncharacterized protein VirK/YbjX